MLLEKCQSLPTFKDDPGWTDRRLNGWFLQPFRFSQTFSLRHSSQQQQKQPGEGEQMEKRKFSNPQPNLFTGMPTKAGTL